MMYYPKVELDKSKIVHIKTSNNTIIVSQIKLMIPIYGSSELYKMYIGWSTLVGDNPSPEEFNVKKIEAFFNDLFNEKGWHDQSRGNFLRGGLRSVDFRRIEDLQQLEAEVELFEDKKK